MSSGRRLVFGVAAVVAVTLAAYAPTIGHEFLMDDPTYIVENPAVTQGVPFTAYLFDRNMTASRSDFRWQSYRPVRTLAFRALVATFGLRTAPFGVANLVLYALSIVLVALLLVRLAGDRTAALAATALWALMPVHVEPVVYASALGDHLSLVFQLLAFFAAARAVPAKRNWIAYLLLSLVLAFLAMGAKEMAVTEGGILALAVACAWRGLTPALRRRAVVLVVSHGAVTLGFLVLRTHVIGAVGQGAITALTAQVASRAIPLYLWKYALIVFAPLGHAAAYAAVPLKRGPAALAWLGVLVVVVALWRLKRPTLTFAFGWFALSLLPVLHVVPLLAYYADRFAFVPSIGLALAVGHGLAATRGRLRTAALAAALLLSLLYVAGILVEERAWRSDATLWRFAAAAQPDAALAHSNLAIELLHEGAPAEALVQLEEVRRISGAGPATLMQMAVADDMLGRSDDAERALHLLLRESTELPDSHALLASLLVRRGALAEAEPEVAAALALSPELPSAWMAKGQLAEARGQWPAALAAYRHAVERSPSARYHLRYGEAALRAGDRATAAAEARACLVRQPGRPDCRELLTKATAPSQ
jgi:tetratricopeptide (TPR) repeat protein